jgi:hypothetical protein
MMWMAVNPATTMRLIWGIKSTVQLNIFHYIGGLHAASRAEGAEEKSFNKKFGPFIPCRPDFRHYFVRMIVKCSFSIIVFMAYSNLVFVPSVSNISSDLLALPSRVTKYIVGRKRKRKL